MKTNHLTVKQVLNLIKTGKLTVKYYGETHNLSGRIGYVYEDGKQSYWINSNLENTQCIICRNGHLYAERIM